RGSASRHVCRGWSRAAAGRGRNGFRDITVAAQRQCRAVRYRAHPSVRGHGTDRKRLIVMKDISLVVVGGGAGLGALVADMAVASGTSGLGVIDIDPIAGEAALGPARA